MNDMRKPVAVPAIGIEQGPDATLIALCATFASAIEGEREVERPYTARLEDAPDEMTKPFHDQARGVLDQMLDTKAITMAGVMARARALFVYDPEIIVPGSNGSGGWRDDQAMAIIRDLLALGADAGNLDAELIRLCDRNVQLEKDLEKEYSNGRDIPIHCPIMAEMNGNIEQISLIQATTLEGFRARARAIVAYAPELVRVEEIPDLAMKMGAAQLRDLVGEEVR